MTPAAESGRGLQSRFFFFKFTINSYRSFRDVGNRDEGQLRKTELKLYEVVIGTVFRPLFHGIVQTKVLLSFGSSSLFFLPLWKHNNQRILMYENGFSLFWFIRHHDFSSQESKQKGRKNWKCAAIMDSHMSFIACRTTHCSLLPYCRYGFIALDRKIILIHLYASTEIQTVRP